MKLNQILKGIEYEIIKGTMDEEIIDIAYDSRKVVDGTLFLSNFGIKEDNEKYLPMAIKNGAKVIVTSKNINVPDNVTIIKVSNSKDILSKLSLNFFNYPQTKLTTIAITGTKGKTTVSFMLKKILECAGYKCGLIGTTGIYIDNVKYKTNNTTPESYDILKYLNQMLSKNIDYAIMEVSSQALKYDRVAGITFDYGIFTNLSKDHIGPYEHDNMEDYIRSKAKLFTKCHHGILNIDDKYYSSMIKNTTIPINTYGYNKKAHLRITKIKNIHNQKNLGIKITTDGLIKTKFKISSPGKFSSYNALAAILTSYLLGINIKNIKKALSHFSVIGRVEPIIISKKYKLLIDYAHNGTSTKNILSTIREYNPQRLVTIFGCGGNRSKERRYEMGLMAGKYSDFCIITEDNNRYETFNTIAKDILIGISKTNCQYIIIPKRKEAIKYAIKNARKGDVIMLLGKGHEDYLEVNGEKIPFDERSIIKKVLREIKK